MELTAANIKSVIHDCLFKDEEVAKPVLPRPMWGAFPGGLPYIVVTL